MENLCATQSSSILPSSRVSELILQRQLQLDGVFFLSVDQTSVLRSKSGLMLCNSSEVGTSP